MRKMGYFNMGICCLLEPASSGQSRNCSFLYFLVDFNAEVGSLLLREDRRVRQLRKYEYTYRIPLLNVETVMWAEKLGKQLGRPTKSLAGWLISRWLAANNTVLEESAVQLCRIQPGETVLELGHGPGLGLQSAAKLLTEPTGHLIGVDYSEYMHQVASKLMKELVDSGKVTLYHCDVAAMPMTDSTVDKVFHCNCYYFWPDLKKGATEIHRVMKPGGLMVTTMNLSRVAAFAAKGVMPKNWQPENYMAALRVSGFTDVRVEDKQHKNITFQAIYATALK